MSAPIVYLNYTLTKDITFDPGITVKRGEVLQYGAMADQLRTAASQGKKQTIIDLAVAHNRVQFMHEIWPVKQSMGSFTLTKDLKFSDAGITALTGDSFVTGPSGDTAIVRGGLPVGIVGMRQADIDWMVNTGVLVVAT